MNISVINCINLWTFCSLSIVIQHLPANKCSINDSHVENLGFLSISTRHQGRRKSGSSWNKGKGARTRVTDLSFIEFPRFLSRTRAKLSIQFVRAEYRFPIHGPRDFGKHHRPYVYTRNPFDLRFHANKGGSLPPHGFTAAPYKLTSTKYISGEKFKNLRVPTTCRHGWGIISIPVCRSIERERERDRRANSFIRSRVVREY